ncbi:hypothetical protein CB1_000327031 [Camelus ferus]|nr:hypothetical protein CB1_000327031 [Camelus ferus]
MGGIPTVCVKAPDRAAAEQCVLNGVIFEDISQESMEKVVRRVSRHKKLVPLEVVRVSCHFEHPLIALMEKARRSRHGCFPGGCKTRTGIFLLPLLWFFQLVSSGPSKVNLPVDRWLR